MYRDLPFKGILGQSTELEVLQFLIAEPYDFYNISELSDILELNRNTVARIIKKLKSHEMLQFRPGRGRSKCFRLNGFSKIVKSIDVLVAGIIDETDPDLCVFETTLKAFLPKMNGYTDITGTLSGTDLFKFEILQSPLLTQAEPETPMAPIRKADKDRTRSE